MALLLQGSGRKSLNFLHTQSCKPGDYSRGYQSVLPAAVQLSGPGQLCRSSLSGDKMKTLDSRVGAFKVGETRERPQNTTTPEEEIRAVN